MKQNKRLFIFSTFEFRIASTLWTSRLPLFPKLNQSLERKNGHKLITLLLCLVLETFRFEWAKLMIFLESYKNFIKISSNLYALESELYFYLLPYSCLWISEFLITSFKFIFLCLLLDSFQKFKNLDKELLSRNLFLFSGSSLVGSYSLNICT